METQEYYAFLGHVLADESFTLDDKIEAEAELTNYYQCLSDIAEQFNGNELSAEQMDCIYADYVALTGSERLSEFEHIMATIEDSFMQSRQLIGA